MKPKKKELWYNKVNWLYVILGIYIIIYLTHLLIRYHFVLWDEAVYVGIGKYIFSSGNIGLWEDIRPLGLSVLLGLAWKLKLNPIIAGRFIELMFSIGSIFLVFKISELIFRTDSNKNTIAILSTIIYAITPLFFYNSLRLMTGIPSTFFVLSAVYVFLKRRYMLAGLFSSLAFIFRYPNGLIVVCILSAIFIEYLLKEKDKTTLKQIANTSFQYIIGLLPLIITLFIFNYFRYKSILYPLLKASTHGGNLVHAVQDILLNIFYYLFNLFIQNHLLIFSLLGLYLSFRYIKKNNKTTIICVSLIIYLVYFTYTTNKQPRFALSFLPFAAILAGYGLYKLFRWFNSIKINSKSIQLKKSYNNNNNNSKWLRTLPIILLVMFTLYSVSLSLNKDYFKFNSFPSEKPAIVDEYYRFFDNYKKNIILTADPVHIAYSDIKMIPYYYSVEEAMPILNTWLDTPELRQQVKAIVFIHGPFVCFDTVCEEQLRPALFEKIKGNTEYKDMYNYDDNNNNNNNELVFKKEYEEVKSIYYVN
ncbi:MAG: hypothetical protein ABIG89_06145 [Candidatus Woesearchaeota archaeon]